MGCCSSNAPVTAPNIKSQNQAEPDRETSPICTKGFFVHKEQIHKSYILKRLIGSGQFGSVRIAVPANRSTKQKFAVKSIAKDKIHNKKQLKRELEILHCMDHPNIIKLYEVYEDNRYIHLVTELCVGGDLFSHILEQEQLAEEQAAFIVYKVLLAIHHLHSLNYSHRDIKAENVLFTDTGPNCEIKLIDFGLSNKFAEDREMHSLVGSPHYVAPEVLQKEYGPECDIWSIGVLMYFLISGTLPFLSETRREIYRKIIQCDYTFCGSIWGNVSALSKDLVTQLLNPNRKTRITAAEALEHG